MKEVLAEGVNKGTLLAQGHAEEGVVTHMSLEPVSRSRVMDWLLLPMNRLIV